MDTPANLPTVPHSESFIAQVLAELASKGLTLCIEGPRIFIYNEKAKRRSSAARRQAAYRARRAARAITKRNEASQTHNAHLHLTPSFGPGNYHGLTWRHMTGKTEIAKKCSFSEFKRGNLPGYESCRGLEGRALRDEFARVKAARRESAMRGSRKELAKQPD